MLIECNECRKQISDKAKTCPHCGNPIKCEDDQVLIYMEKRARFGLKLCKVSVIIGLLLFLPACITKNMIIFGFCAILIIPAILGLLVNNIRLSHLQQSKNLDKNKENKDNNFKKLNNSN